LGKNIGQKVYLPHPTWANHRSIFESAGFVVDTLNYYNRDTHGFDRISFLQGLKNIEPKGIVVFHAVCHNPTGCDPTFLDWKEISEVCKEKALLPFFDFAYQGFGEGLEEDAKVIRLFLEEGHELFIAYSCAKNFSLYCQRVGALLIVSSNPAVKLRVGSQIKRVIRAMYSNPPAHGTKIVLKILSDPHHYKDWEKQVGKMRHRISYARESLVKKLNAKAANTDFSFLKSHRGMFSYLDLTKHQVQELIDRYGIYTLDSGRINVAGLTAENIDFVVDSIISVCE
jgi:aromatic-amino-acid transaminase